MSNKNFDTCVSFSLAGGAFVGRLTRLSGVLEQILQRHTYPANVSSALSETTALAVLLSSALKYDGLFTLQIQGNGPVSLLVADVTSQGCIRASSKFDEQKLLQAKKLRKTEDVFEPLPHLVGGGYMAFTVEQKNMQPYQGVVDLEGKTLTDFALRYFKLSEQIETSLKLFTQNPAGESQSFLSAGLIVQKVPLKGGTAQEQTLEEQAQLFEDIQAFTSSLKEDEVFDSSLSSADILHRLFHSVGLQINTEKQYTFGCRCSRDKFLKTLQSFKPEELSDMFDLNGQLEATCHFCGEKYIFNRQDFSKH